MEHKAVIITGLRIQGIKRSLRLVRHTLSLHQDPSMNVIKIEYVGLLGIPDIDLIGLLSQKHRFIDDLIDDTSKLHEKILRLEVVLSIICVLLHEAALLERADSFVHHKYHEELVVGIEG